MSSIDPRTGIGAVTLRVADARRAASFYRQVLGLVDMAAEDGSGTDGGTVALGAPDGNRPLLRLAEDPDAPARPGRTTGLFHFAVLVPSRAELARSLRRVAESGWRLTGASDHLVSEALYLNDPEGNGIEIYWDRPRGEWRRSEAGELAMATLPLDLDSLLAETAPEGDEDGGDSGSAVAPGTIIGHVHLNVSDLAAAEEFYAGELGFDVMVRGYPGALFVAAGGYHHHIGLNTWNGVGAPAPPPGALGLAHFEIEVPGLAEPQELTDPSGIHLRLTPLPAVQAGGADGPAGD